MKGRFHLPDSNHLLAAGMGALLLVGGVAGALPFSAPAAQARTAKVKAAPNGHFIVRARINGVRAEALIDTGASAVVIPYGKALRMRLHPRSMDFNVIVRTANGKARAARTILRKVEIKGVVAHDVEALVMQKGALDKVLIGTSYLGKLRRYAVKDSVMRLEN